MQNDWADFNFAGGKEYISREVNKKFTESREVQKSKHEAFSEKPFSIKSKDIFQQLWKCNDIKSYLQ